VPRWVAMTAIGVVLAMILAFAIAAASSIR
jgi:hypothetical protein